MARIYGVETRALNQAVRRNQDRFPAEFLFQLTADEASVLHDGALRDIYQKLRPLPEPPGVPPKPQIGFHVKEDAVPYHVKRKTARP